MDGFQIRTLILTMLYRLVPTLIQDGYVYIAESPLFEITCKDKTWFAYSNREKDEIVQKSIGESKKYHHSALQGTWRERPGYDVDDHHEPCHPAAD